MLIGNKRKIAELVHTNCKTLELVKLIYYFEKEEFNLICDSSSYGSYTIEKSIFFDANKNNQITKFYFNLSLKNFLHKLYFYLIGLLVAHALFYFQIKKSINKKVLFELESASNKIHLMLARKLAHDIRSPLSSLNLISSKINDRVIKDLQLQVINQINIIADDLLNPTKRKIITFDELLSLITTEISYKTDIFNRKISLKKNITDKDLTALIPANFQSHITNLLQNSIEATSSENCIELVFLSVGKRIEIRIKDNGIGMPEHILRQIGKTEISFDSIGLKSLSGNGIALMNLFTDVEKLDGKIDIQSEVNLGTEIIISLHANF